MGTALISKMSPGVSVLARPELATALLQRGFYAGQQFGIAHRMDQRTAHANLRAGDALHH